MDPFGGSCSTEVLQHVLVPVIELKFKERTQMFGERSVK